MVSINLTPRIFDLLRHSQTGSTHLYLIRHGQTDGNLRHQLIGHTDMPLDELGMVQAAQVGEHMRDVPLDSVISSPLVRAHFTAERVAEHHGLTVTVDDRLREMHFGDAEGMTMAEAIARFPEIARLRDFPDDPDFAWPGGAPRAMFHAEVLTTMSDIALAHLDRHVAVVCHGGVIGSFIAQLDGGSPYDFAAYPVANCSVTHLEVHADGTTEHRYNDVAHLESVATDVWSFAAEIDGIELEGSTA
jgi:broad specificity phosphatase PhoE